MKNEFLNSLNKLSKNLDDFAKSLNDDELDEKLENSVKTIESITDKLEKTRDFKIPTLETIANSFKVRRDEIGNELDFTYFALVPLFLLFLIIF